MRKLMAAIAIVLVAGMPVRSWAMLAFEDVKFDGSLETSVVRAGNEADTNDDAATDDDRSDVDTRLRLGMNLKVTEGVAGRLEFTRTGSRYGQNLAGTPGGANSLNNEQDAIKINNALVAMNLWSWQWILGRQYVGDSGDLVWFIGPRSDDNLSI